MSARPARRTQDALLDDTVPVLSVYSTPENLRVAEWKVDGRTHRVDGPALLIHDPDTNEKGMYWHRDGRYHRLDGPAQVITRPDDVGRLSWHENGTRTRSDDPAHVGDSGNMAWDYNGRTLIIIDHYRGGTQ